MRADPNDTSPQGTNYVCTRVRVNVCTCERVRVRVYVCVYTLFYVYVCVYVCVYVYLHVYVNVIAHVYLYDDEHHHDHDDDYYVHMYVYGCDQHVAMYVDVYEIATGSAFTIRHRGCDGMYRNIDRECDQDFLSPIIPSNTKQPKHTKFKHAC